MRSTGGVGSTLLLHGHRGAFEQAPLHGLGLREADQRLAVVPRHDPVEQPEKVASVIARVANPTSMRVNQLLLECEQILSSTDVRNLAQAATATAELGDIERTLAGLKEH